ncbi:hypothetical protein ACFSDG_09665 [Pseudarcicella hirudinis]|nr:hypothetical protein [Pseudarcicella hirudinis]
MSLQVLFASTGFAMTEHFCRISRIKTYFVHKDEGCCSKKSEKLLLKAKQIVRKDKCCDLQTIFSKINTESNSNYNFDLKAPQLNWALLNTQIPVFSEQMSGFVSFQVPHYYSPAPPPSGRQLLILNQSFLI